MAGHYNHLSINWVGQGHGTGTEVFNVRYLHFKMAEVTVASNVCSHIAH